MEDGDKNNAVNDADPYCLDEEQNVEKPNSADPYALEEEEDSIEDLLREIEEEEAKEEALREAAITRAKSRGEPLEPGSQLTDFQEQIITTGSGVGKAMLLLLVIAFIVKSIEHCFRYAKRKAALAKVKAAISSTKSRSVDEYNEADPNFNRLEYIKYNSEFKAAAEMDEKIRQGMMEKRVLVRLLGQRAYELMHRRAVLMTNEMSVTRAYKMDMLPLEVWSDFQAAKEALQKEIKTVQFLSHSLGVNFKKLMDGASDQMKKRNRKKRGTALRSNLMKKNAKNKRATKNIQQAQGRTKQQDSKTKASRQSSSSPVLGTPARKALAKGIRPRRKR